MDGKRIIARNDNGPAQPIERQPLDKRLCLIRFAIYQHIIAIGPNEEIKQRLALWGQQTCPNGQRAQHIIGDKALKEAAHIFSRQTDDSAI